MAAKGAQVQTLFANRSEPIRAYTSMVQGVHFKLFFNQNAITFRVRECAFGGDEMRGRFASARPIVGLLPLLLYPSAGWSASPPKLPSTVEPGHEQLILPSIPEGDFEFSIPTPRKSPIPKDVESLRFPIQEISVDGMTVLSADDIAPIISPLLAQEKSLPDVMAAAEAIEAKYRKYGYLLTKAFVPPQKSKLGVFKIKVVEGYIKNVLVDGVDGGLRSRITSMLSVIISERPVTTSTVERALLLVNEIPGIKATGLLKPSTDEVGAADLDLTVTHQMVEGTVGIDNRGSKYSGPISANADVAMNSAFGHGEQIGVGVTRSTDPHKQRGIRAHYTQPLGDDGLTAQTFADHTLAVPGWTLREQGIVTASTNVGQRFSYPLIRSREENLLLDGGFTMKSARTTLLGSVYSQDTWRVFDMKTSWSENGWLDGSTAATVGMAKGVTLAGSSHQGDANLSRTNANPDFTKVTMDAKRVQPLTSDWSLLVGTAGQYAANKLLAGEEFALGGNQFGRGFDPSSLTGDHGVAGTAEMHYNTQTGWHIAETAQFYGFYDQGVVWSRGSSDGGQSLSSTGVGVRSVIDENTTVGFEFAHALHGPDPTVSADPGRFFFSLQNRF